MLFAQKRVQEAENYGIVTILALDKCNRIGYKMEDMEYKEFEVVEKP